ncbi:hypothetical protein K435DRAFT_703261, partial [Dendrothele bispora CBS 962.96]
HSEWTESDCNALLTYVEENKASSENSKGFKNSFWQGCAVVLNQKRTAGGPKTWTACRSKWQRDVSLFIRLNAFR